MANSEWISAKLVVKVDTAVPLMQLFIHSNEVKKQLLGRNGDFTEGFL